MAEEPIISKYQEPFRCILLFGPPGSGKGTIGKFLSSAGNHFHLSSGDIFRGLSPESPAGQLYHTYASKGLLIPDEITLEIWHQFVLGLIATNRYFPKQQLLLLDGIPRTLHQANLLEKHIHIEKIIVLDIQNTEKLIQRLQRRALLEKRMDDKDVQVLRTRMDIYHKDTAKILNHYPKRQLAIFNADQKPLEVLRDILTELSSIL